jgi:hypothetical protein
MDRLHQQFATSGVFDDVGRQFRGNDTHPPYERIVEIMTLRQALRCAPAVSHLT